LSETQPLRSLMRDRTVGLLVSVELLMSLGFGATATTLGWQGYSRAHDPLVLGLIGLAEFIPAVLLALPAGHAADSHDRRRVTALGLAVVTGAAVALAVDAGRGDTAVWPLYVLAFVIGIGNAYSAPAVGPLLAAGVSQEMLARAVAVLMSVMQAAMIAGPAVAGLLQVVGPSVPYAFAAVCAVLAMVMVMLVPKAIGRAHVAEQEASLSDALAGVRFIFDTPALLGAISLDLMAVLFGGATALLPVFSQTILHVGAFGNGLLRAAPGIGAVVVGSVLSGRPLKRRVGRTLLIVVALYGAFTIVFGFSTSFALSMAALAALAGADMVSMSIRGTLAPLLTAPALRGRVGAVERVFIGASNELGAFESGVAAALIGAVPAVLLGGVASIVVALVWAWKFPALRRIDRFEDIDTPAVPPAARLQRATEPRQVAR
jgi:MFS family permease